MMMWVSSDSTAFSTYASSLVMGHPCSPGATPQPARVDGFGEPYCSPTTGTETTNPQFAGPRWVFARSYSGMDQPTTQFLGDSLRIKSGQRDETSSRISSLIHSIRPVALDESADAGKVI